MRSNSRYMKAVALYLVGPALVALAASLTGAAGLEGVEWPVLFLERAPTAYLLGFPVLILLLALVRLQEGRKASSAAAARDHRAKANVYFVPIDGQTDLATIHAISRTLLDTLVEKEHVTLEATIPLKVHFGEAKNVTFVRPENYQGIIDWLKERNIASSYMETCVLYGGQRFKKELHEKTAQAHGFTQLPVVFADGEHGEAFAEVEINKKHFATFKVGRAFLDYEQLLVLSHFKGHMLAGFGGAIKQLSMGFASKGGKMAMHLGEKPHLVSRKCKQCRLCLTRCNVDAITIGTKSWIDKDKCVGCGACLAICPHEAVSIFSAKGIAKFLGIGNPFIDKVVEGAYAAQLGKRNLYLNFAMNLTAGCDCEPKRMKPLIDDFGIFASTDPVAIDKACYDLAAARGKRFRGAKTFAYAEQIGLGSSDYELHELEVTAPRREETERLAG